MRPGWGSNGCLYCLGSRWSPSVSPGLPHVLDDLYCGISNHVGRLNSVSHGVRWYCDTMCDAPMRAHDKMRGQNIQYAPADGLSGERRHYSRSLLDKWVVSANCTMPHAALWAN
jgi:hypothetical protein